MPLQAFSGAPDTTGPWMQITLRRSALKDTDPTEQIDKPEQLLGAGSITQAEPDRLKQSALEAA